MNLVDLRCVVQSLTFFRIPQISITLPEMILNDKIAKWFKFFNKWEGVDKRIFFFENLI